MAGLISQEDGLFKVSFPFSGRQHEVHSLCTLAEAGVVGMALAVRAAEELQQALDAVAPGRQGQPSFQLPGDAGLGTSPLPPAPFCQLAEQLQACANWRSMELSNIYAAEPGEEEDGHDMAPLCGLLAAAASLGCSVAAHALVQLNPSAASADSPWEGAGSIAHRAATLGHVEALCVLLQVAPGSALARSQGYFDTEGLEHNDWSVMHSAADGGSLEAVLVLLEAAPELATAVTDFGWTPLHVAAVAGHATVVQALLQAAPEAALFEDEGDQLPLHRGAAHEEVVRLLLEAAPDTALARADDGSTALHHAAHSGSPAAVQALLQAAPAAALVADDTGWLPLHQGTGHQEVVRLLLAAAPDTAAARTADGKTALHCTASEWAPAAVQELLQATPAAVWVADDRGFLPLHSGVGNAAVIRLLLAAAPSTMLARTADGSTALHCAACHNRHAAVPVLLEAAPEAASMADAEGHTPLQRAVRHSFWSMCTDDKLEALGVLVAAAPSPATLAAIAQGGRRADPLFADFIAAAPPLTAEQWALVPAPCPRLGRALSAALAHSHKQACQIVRRLPSADAARLRTFALALARLQRRLCVALPGCVAGRLLCLCLAE